jgi:hypothetical protein
MPGSALFGPARLLCVGTCDPIHCTSGKLPKKVAKRMSMLCSLIAPAIRIIFVRLDWAEPCDFSRIRDRRNPCQEPKSHCGNAAPHRNNALMYCVTGFGFPEGSSIRVDIVSVKDSLDFPRAGITTPQARAPDMCRSSDEVQEGNESSVRQFESRPIE